MLNTLKYANLLEEVGLTRKQAEAHMMIMAEIVETHLATKHDIELLKQSMLQLEYRLTLKLGTIVSIAIGVAVALARII